MWLVFFAGFACGLLAYGVLEAIQLRRVAMREREQRALGLTFGAVGGEPRTPAQVDAQMLRRSGVVRER